MKICPVCGRSEKEVEFIGNFCKKCYLKRFEVVKFPRKLVLRVCPICGKINNKEEGSVRNVKKWLLKKMRTEEEVEWSVLELRKAKKKWFAKLSIILRVKGVRVEVIKNLVINIVKEKCDECRIKSSEYFDSIIQIRGRNKIKRRLEEEIEKCGGMIKQEHEVKKGVDVIAVNSKAVIKAINELKIRAKISKKLIGQNREGKRKYRTTFLIKL